MAVFKKCVPVKSPCRYKIFALNHGLDGLHKIAQRSSRVAQLVRIYIRKQGRWLDRLLCYRITTIFTALVLPFPETLKMGQDFSASNLRCNNSQVMPVHGENYRANVSVLSKDLRGQGIARFDVLFGCDMSTSGCYLKTPAQTN